MSQYIDSYYLIDHRAPDLVNEFINTYLPEREESSDDYPVPLYSDFPSLVFKDVNELLSYLELNDDLEYSVYWRSTDANAVIKHCMVFYTNDKKMIFGISINGNNPEDPKSIAVYKEVQLFLKSRYGCICVEEPPPHNSVEFLEFCKERYFLS